MAGKMTLKGGGAQRDLAGEIAMMQQAVTQYEFQNCIVEHNLEDDSGNLLQFPADFSRLNPRIGAEIADLIDRMNQFEVDEGNSSNGSGSSSTLTVVPEP